MSNALQLCTISFKNIQVILMLYRYSNHWLVDSVEL